MLVSLFSLFTKSIGRNQLKNLKYGILIVTVLFTCLSLTAEDALVVRQNTNFAWASNSVSIDDGVVSIWADTKTSIWNIYVQKVDAAGNKLWNNGQPVLLDENVDTSAGPMYATVSSDNCVIFLWMDRISGNNFRMYSQKINSAGEFLWSQNNELLVDNTFICHPNLIANEVDGAFVFYLDAENNGIIGINLDANANNLWSAIPDPLFVDISLREIISDNNGGVIIIYTELSDEEILMAARINFNREILWNGIVAILLPSYYYPKITAVGSSNFIIWWRWDENVIGQRFDLNGNQYWGDEGMEINNEAVSEFGRVEIAGAENSFFMAYSISTPQPNEYNFKLQKFDLNGTALWADAAILDECLYSSAYFFDLLPREDEGCCIDWLFGSELYAQQIDANGNKFWGNDGILLGTDYDSGWTQGGVQINELNDQIFCTWQLIKGGKSHLRYQCLDSTGNILLPGDGIDIQSGMQSGFGDYQLIGNDDSSYSLWGDARFGFGRIFAQRISPEGENYFPEFGIAITDTAFSNQFNFVAKTLPDGGVAVTWCEVKENEELKRVRWQILNPEGTVLSPNGNDITVDVMVDQTNPQIDIVDGNIIILWVEEDKIVTQKLNNYSPVWGNNGSLLIENCDTVYTTLIGNYICFEYLEEFYFNCIDENGNLDAEWPFPGVEVSTSRWHINTMTEFNGDLVFMWKETPQGHRNYGFQILNMSGDYVFPGSGFVIAENVTFNDHDYLFDGCINLFHEAETGFDIIMERYDLQGNEIWSGTTIQNNDYIHSLNSTKLGENFLVTWYVNSNEYTNSYMMHMIDAEGNPITSNITSEDFEIYSDRSEYQLTSMTDNDAAIMFHRGYDVGSETTFFSSGLVSYLVNVSDVPIIEDEIVKTTKCNLSNYPNPFNPTTEIRFQISDFSEVESIEIEIYNLKGQKVKSFSNLQITQSPNHQIVWDGTDQNSKPVSSGVYLYKLEVDGKTKVSKKCLLLK
ncbi:MAG: T9SS type A sorting domain-containing protein [Candidatus Cloacimonadales bacterium]|nr:T9SS type A sorting domain-containing protein [Candidatus Cloacimonadales bacterium]